MIHIPGAHLHSSGCQFTVWAPLHPAVYLHLLKPVEQMLPMQQAENGYFVLDTDAKAGTLYYYHLPDTGDFPDPASHYQPDGVDGPSAVVDHEAYNWQDTGWKGLPLPEFVIYELHTGCFTEEGRFEAVVQRLDDLLELGINAIELMPVAQFPGARNWGYDGVFPYAVQNSYGGSQGLKKLVDACHQKGMAVLLDVVYNHLGPEGNCLKNFGPYFSKKHITPWGDALNFDGEYSDAVRDYFAENMAYWFTHYHIDGLRLDAIHEVYDTSAIPFWELLHRKRSTLSEQAGRPLYLLAESDLNNPHILHHPEAGGMGFDAQWLDDFHHALYVLLDEQGKKHYVDFGSMEQLAKAFKEGFVHSGQYVSFRKRKFGASSAGIPGDRFIVFCQNHDLVGNRPGGERLSMLLDTARLKLAAAAVLLSPYIPMLFMGEEYGALTPFYYFASPSGAQLIEALREGRRKNYSVPEWDQLPPDALDPAVFKQCVLQWSQRNEGVHHELLQWYTSLIRLRRAEPALQNTNKDNITIKLPEEGVLEMLRIDPETGTSLVCFFNFGTGSYEVTMPDPTVDWQQVLVSQDHSALPLHCHGSQPAVLPGLCICVYKTADTSGNSTPGDKQANSQLFLV